ncbi:MAG: biotin--[acetyl-CoA-carboxylase] ligase [Gammaproteobacteria bacterium]|nr:biotin--[acetyl-CoA-carboxylase] ligase [Gammaproteobacteria bacterium]
MAVQTSGALSARALVAALADGQVHSGEALAASLGVSRAAVWKAIERLRSDGIAVAALPRRGYQLERAIELLEETRLVEPIAPARRSLLRRLTLPFETDSTNTRLLEAGPPPLGMADACSAEIQRAGRGRRGRSWLAPFGDAIALSTAWQFAAMPRDLPSLGLAAGVVIARALQLGGARGIGLKWPNDLWLGTAKLGGILVDLRAEADGPVHVVIGVGVNLRLSPAARASIQRTGVRAAALADACERPPSRNRIAGLMLDGLLDLLERFEREGFAPYRERWAELDVLAGRRAVVVGTDERVAGIARGIAADGALRLECDGAVRRFLSGDVSLRLEEDLR